jgi:hypothetical protein
MLCTKFFILFNRITINCILSYLQLMFKQLYGNSGRQQGTLRYYREKLQRRNVTCDIKHYEDCEQLFISVGKSFTVAAILDFFI